MHRGVIGCALVMVGCGVRFEDLPAEETAELGGQGGDGGVGATGGSGGGGGGGGAACVDFEVEVEADSVIFAGECDGSIYRGQHPYVNVGAGRGLFRFALDAELTSAFAEGRVAELALRLPRAADCDGTVCPAVAGTLDARPLRNDWAEGSSPDWVSYSGADYCRRESGQGAAGWDTPGAIGLDSGALSGSGPVDTVQTMVGIELSAEEHAPFVGSALSVIVTSTAARFVAATREQGQGARLAGSYCAR